MGAAIYLNLTQLDGSAARVNTRIKCA